MTDLLPGKVKMDDVDWRELWMFLIGDNPQKDVAREAEAYVI